ncbi:transporter [Candidatus Nomurabacteria bacterium CG_4_9_14_0_2_um_filter_32_10]|uniref:Probable queuosine precursor transporter n=1 Tax=Candidatus Nomurabacteria bacterium CG_4_9_14_0_2_um_filter_32_10 TaxID=1974729 RepID=A0A2J0N3Z0_9BACT|nr:MAG: transporter [Candidatus Nomurabacteria bacterium CG_4_9_14_0_2_um_filter_32_10]
MQQLTEKDYKKILICLTLYITSLIAANTLGIKLMPFLFDTHLSVAVFFFPFVFMMTDIIGEVYGKRMAKLFVLAGFVSTFIFLIYTIVSQIMPWSGNALWVKDGFNQVFSLSLRFSIASLLAFVIAEYQDVFAFFFFKKRIGEKHFWIRSNLSNVWSQFLDSAIFSLVAFWGIYPLSVIIAITIPWWIYKVLMGFFYTPLSYIGIRLLRGGSARPHDVSGAGENNNENQSSKNKNI